MANDALKHRRTFRARGLLGLPAVQTMGASLPWWTGRLVSTMRRVPITGGAVHLHVTLRAERGPAALLVHGLGGSSESAYVLRAANALLAEGFHVARLDLRGAGASLADAPTLYHAGLSHDVELAAEELARDPMVEGVGILGFSLGGNMVLKLAGEWGATPPAYARAVVSVSSLVDLAPASKALETAVTFPYRVYIMRSLIAAARGFAKAHPGRSNFRTDRLTPISTVREYDRDVVVPMHGFESVEHYYQTQSSGPLLRNVTVPTLFAFAEDDPMIPASSVKPWLDTASSHVDVAWSNSGGHVGWFETISREAFVLTWPIKTAVAFLRGRM